MWSKASSLVSLGEGDLLHRLLVIASLAAVSMEPCAAAPPASRSSAEPLQRSQFLAEMDAEFKRTDADRNGLLTRAEIERHQRQRAIAQSRARNRAMFAQLDEDGNGQLSASEFAKIATPAPNANAEPVLSRMDSNRDDRVSLAEHRAATLANFDRLDRDRDGNVTAEEMKSGGLASR